MCAVELEKWVDLWLRTCVCAYVCVCVVSYDECMAYYYIRCA